MIKYQKHMAQYATIIALGFVGTIVEKHFMLKSNCSGLEYALAIFTCIFTFFLWLLYVKEKRNCQNILTKELNDRYVVTISKSKWNDLIVKITVKNIIFNSSIHKTLYNP